MFAFRQPYLYNYLDFYKAKTLWPVSDSFGDDSRCSERCPIRSFARILAII
jgi:hypothetical protein